MPSDTTADTGPMLDAEGRAVREMGSQSQAAGDQLVEAVRRQPITVAIVIFVIGYTLGKECA